MWPLLWLLLASPLVVATLVLGHRAELGPAASAWDAVIVLGCGLRPDGRPSIALERRVEAAVALWQTGVAAKLVLTGGVGGGALSEARSAARFAGTLGVPASAMILEERSTSTYENARFAAELTGYRRVVIATDDYHVWRSVRVFAQHFEQVGAVASTHPSFVARVRGALREAVAIGAYAILGRL